MTRGRISNFLHKLGYSLLVFGALYTAPVALNVIAPNLAFAQDLQSLYPLGFSQRSIRKLERKASKKGGKVNVTSLADVCPSVQPMSGALMKNAYPGHIQRTDPRASGFAFICGSSCPSKFPVSAYYSDGTLAFKLGYYGRWSGNGKPRAYCSVGVPRCSVKKVVRDSKTSGRDGKVYLTWTSTSCRSATPGVRNSSGF